MPKKQTTSLQKDGFEILERFVNNDILEGIKDEINLYDTDFPKYGIRSAEKKFSNIDNLVNSELLVNKANKILGAKPQVVRVIYFDKTEENNWLVPWHQDRTIALSKKINVEGWGRWSVKDGVHHVQPSIDVLDNMVTFRVHLDDSNRDNGCLKVISRTNTLGLLNKEQIQAITSENSHEYCEVKAGDILLMRPHILHASSKGKEPKHRRIVHIEYSSYELPLDVEWA